MPAELLLAILHKLLGEEIKCPVSAAVGCLRAGKRREVRIIEVGGLSRLPRPWRVKEGMRDSVFKVARDDSPHRAHVAADTRRNRIFTELIVRQEQDLGSTYLTRLVRAFARHIAQMLQLRSGN